MFLRSEEPDQENGVVKVLTLFELSRNWYDGRLDPDFTPPSRDALQARLSAVGMTGDFWQLPG